uniref:uncharacterized protein LOC127068650 isoform X2 n=1 Tax=Vespula vulgaris TaxID=7454 RepID=UPI0021241512|nr:uncharacterized protein LOC127068650 isoform X2 [Vespula vulgaris]
MSIRGMSYYEKHFFFSNRLVKLLIGLRPSQNVNKQLLLFCIVTVYVFPMFVFQFYQLYTSDVTFHSTVKLMHNTLCNLCSLITYGFICLNFEARKLFHAHFILDYARLSDENELMVFKQYTKQSKIYTYFFVGLSII